MPQPQSGYLLHGGFCQPSRATPDQLDSGMLQASSDHFPDSINDSFAHLPNSSDFDPHELSDDPCFSFHNEFYDPHAGLHPSELTDLGVVSNAFGNISSWPPILHGNQSAMKGQCISGCTTGTEDAPATLTAAAAPRELASGIATSQLLTPGRPASKPSTQTNPLCTSSPCKRKATALDDNGGNDSHFRESMICYGDLQFFQSRKLACPFYKMNPKRYMSCGERSISNISALGQHFSKAHKPRLHHCKDCFESFDDKVSEQRHKEPGACVPTGGCSIDNLRGPRGKHEGPAKTWYCYWEQLFPNLAPPASPHTDGLDVLDQCMLSAIQRVILPLGLETYTESNLIHELFSEIVRWRQHSAEPLDHARLRQYGRLPTSSAGSWQEGPRQPTPIRVS